MKYEPKTKIKKIENLSAKDVFEMHSVFQKYYNHTDLETFFQDLIKKHFVLLMFDRDDGHIVGFSTMALLDLQYKGKKVKGLFSGDTILEREYWGARRWQLVWGMFLIKLRLQNLGTPFFWLLISKGYKTYMLMANNFIDYYPRHDKEDVELSKVVDSYCEQLYPDFYRKDEKLLDFGDKYQNLRADIADIDEELRERQSKIKFFEERNPNWRRGVELPCAGVVEVGVLVKFVKKLVMERFGGSNKIQLAHGSQT